jgi:hypothetical protein
MKDHLFRDAPSGFLLKRRTSKRSGKFAPLGANFDLRLTLLSTHVYD